MTVSDKREGDYDQDEQGDEEEGSHGAGILLHAAGQCMFRTCYAGQCSGKCEQQYHRYEQHSRYHRHNRFGYRGYCHAAAPAPKAGSSLLPRTVRITRKRRNGITVFRFPAESPSISFPLNTVLIPRRFTISAAT